MTGEDIPGAGIQRQKKKSRHSNLRALFITVERSHQKLYNKRSLVIHLYMERDCVQVTAEVVSASQREVDLIWSSFTEEMLVESRTSRYAQGGGQ